MRDRPLTRRQYQRAMFFGRIALWVVGLVPIQWVPAWLLVTAGFYAYDDGGYEGYRERLDGNERHRELREFPT